MSLFMDLNLSPSPNPERLQRLVDTAAHLGFSTVAFNYVLDAQKQSKQEVPKPAAPSELLQNIPTVQGKSRPIKILNRLTIVASDVGQFRPNTAEFRRYDLLAIHPTSDKLFHTACMMMDVDIICVTVTEKLPFHLKRATLNAAVSRGVVFELCYSAALRDTTMRRYMLSNAISLVERCSRKSVIISSGTEQPLELRGPYDIANLALLFGLSEVDAKDAVSSTCRSVLLHAESRKTACGIIHTVQCPSEGSGQQGALPQSAEGEVKEEQGGGRGEGGPPAAKKPRPGPVSSGLAPPAGSS